MAATPRILSIASAEPPYRYEQDALAREAQHQLLGPGWERDATKRDAAAQINRLFAATQVQQRQAVVDMHSYYHRIPSTGERMAVYADAAYSLGKAATENCLHQLQADHAAPISDLTVISCTGYMAPGLDILLARDLDMPRDVRRTVIGHMGCYGALVGLRQALATVRAHADARVLLLSVELASLHYTPTDDSDVLTSFALFGDAASAVLIGDGADGAGPELVDAYCEADFSAASQMSWTITDTGFVMGLSPRIPVTLRRTVGGAVERLLAPHGLAVSDITQWIIHPGGPAILEAIQRKLELSDTQMAPSWDVLRAHGNCSSATVLLILEHMLATRQPNPGEWGVMMAFGPGLTLETCLLRF